MGTRTHDVLLLKLSCGGTHIVMCYGDEVLEVLRVCEGVSRGGSE